MLIKGIPATEYKREVILAEVKKLLFKHGARVLNPLKDITFSDSGDQLVLILDGCDPLFVMEPQKEEDEESDEEAEEGAEIPQKKEEPPKKADEEQPKIFNCPACTFENPISAPGCEICGTERPPMEIILADFRAASQPPAATEESKAKEESKEDGRKKSPLEEKLVALARDISRIVSRMERQAFKEQVEKAAKSKEEVKKP